jgi:tRNA(His) 5'-end guanylyltransferase
VRIGKSATETHDLLKKVYGEECLSCTQVFEWFKKGREEIRDNQRPGCSSTPKTNANIEKVSEIVRQNCHLSIQTVAE